MTQDPRPKTALGVLPAGRVVLRDFVPHGAHRGRSGSRGRFSGAAPGKQGSGLAGSAQATAGRFPPLLGSCQGTILICGIRPGSCRAGGACSRLGRTGRRRRTGRGRRPKRRRGRIAPRGRPLRSSAGQGAKRRAGATAAAGGRAAIVERPIRWHVGAAGRRQGVGGRGIGAGQGLGRPGGRRRGRRVPGTGIIRPGRGAPGGHCGASGRGGRNSLRPVNQVHRPAACSAAHQEKHSHGSADSSHPSILHGNGRSSVCHHRKSPNWGRRCKSNVLPCGVQSGFRGGIAGAARRGPDPPQGTKCPVPRTSKAAVWLVPAAGPRIALAG